MYTEMNIGDEHRKHRNIDIFFIWIVGVLYESSGVRLFMTNGFNWIHVGSLACRDVAEDDADGGADGEGHVDGPCWNAGRHAHDGDDKLPDQTS